MQAPRAASVYRKSASNPGPIGLLGEGIRDSIARRQLIQYLVQADLKKKGSDTLFGNIWWVLDPLLQMVIYVILVTVIFARSQEAYPLFIFAAILPWKWFSTSIGDATLSVSGQDKLIRQVQFPKIVLPVAAVMAGIVQFAFGLIPLGAMLALMYPHHASWTLVVIPVVAVVQLVFMLALGLFFSALNVFFRDMTNLTRHVLRLWFYLSPALYGADTVETLSAHHPTVADVMRANPMYTILNAYRDLVYYGRLPEWGGLLVVLALSFVLLGGSIIFFKRLEPTFAKVL